MRKIIFILGLMLSVNATAQAPAIQWQKVLGGSKDDVANSIQKTIDGGYITVGISFSNDGNVTGSHGNYDYWVVKLDNNGTIQWQKTFGGSYNDYAESIQQTSDGGYVIVGFTFSSDGDITSNYGGSDYWIVKLDGNGTLQWQKTFGGSNDDYAFDAKQTNDGGYIICGYTYSNNGNVTNNHGSEDYWIVKLNSTGIMQWQKALGGSDDDEAYSIQQTSDGGYIIAGNTFSNDGDITANHGGEDYWIVKLDNSGIIQWQKTFGGSDNDGAISIEQTSDGGYIVAGMAISSEGDITASYGTGDYWIVKLNSSGIIQWQKTFGGSDNDQPNSIHQTTDGGYIVAGMTYSTDGDVTNNNGGFDYWIIKLNSSGNIQWQKAFGGSDYDMANSILQTNDGGYIIAGKSSSNNGDIKGNHGTSDYWVVKLGSQILPLKLISFTTQLQQNNITLNWHTTNEINVSHFNIQRSNNDKDFTTIGKVNAKLVSSYAFLDEIPTNHLPQSIYYKLEIVDKDGSKSFSEVKRVTLNEKQETRNIVLFPNPATNIINIECAGAKEITITDYLGKTIKQFNHPTQHQTLNTKQLNKGIYIVKAIMNNGEIKTEKLVVQ